MRLRFKCVLATILFLAAVALAGDPIASSEAAAHVGEVATVCGTVVQVVNAWRSRGQPTFLDFDFAYPNSDFDVVIWGSDLAKFGNPAALEHQQVCATGLIQLYRGRPEIIARNAEQLALAPSAHSPQMPSGSAGATAICRDGTYSFSQHRRGTCSHHGGVAQWLGQPPPTLSRPIL